MQRRSKGAFSALVEVEQEARDDLLALRGITAGKEELNSRKDLLDEAGFIVDEKNSLVYVSAAEENRQDGIEHTVVYKKVAVRKGPSIDCHVLGAYEQGQQLMLFDSDDTGSWRKLHFRLRGGHGGLVEAWVMLRHPQLGVLVSRDGEEPPAAAPVAAPAAPVVPAATVREPPKASLHLPEEGDRAAHLAALAAEFGERLELMAEDLHPNVMNLKETFQVVRKPMVAVRSQPSTEGQIVFSVEYGTEVDTFGVDSSGLWRRVFCQCTRVAKQDAPLPREPVEAWIMEEHPSLGPLLRLLH